MGVLPGYCHMEVEDQVPHSISVDTRGGFSSLLKGKSGSSSSHVVSTPQGNGLGPRGSSGSPDAPLNLLRYHPSGEGEGKVQAS